MPLDYNHCSRRPCPDQSGSDAIEGTWVRTVNNPHSRVGQESWVLTANRDDIVDADMDDIRNADSADELAAILKDEMDERVPEGFSWVNPTNEESWLDAVFVAEDSDSLFITDLPLAMRSGLMEIKEDRLADNLKDAIEKHPELHMVDKDGVNLTLHAIKVSNMECIPLANEWVFNYSKITKDRARWKRQCTTARSSYLYHKRMGVNYKSKYKSRNVVYGGLACNLLSYINATWQEKVKIPDFRNVNVRSMSGLVELILFLKNLAKQCKIELPTRFDEDAEWARINTDRQGYISAVIACSVLLKMDKNPPEWKRFIRQEMKRLSPSEEEISRVIEDFRLER